MEDIIQNIFNINIKKYLAFLLQYTYNIVQDTYFLKYI